MTDWKQLLDDASLSIEEIKERLPAEYVVSEAGVVLEPRTDGRLVGVCPFHLDENPSFAIFGDDLQRIGCWSCDFGNGDVFDFIQRWKACSFREAVAEAVRLLHQFESLDGQWQPTPPPPTRQILPEELAERARAAWTLAESDLTAIQHLLVAKGIDLHRAQWLHEEFNVGILDDVTVVIPHLVEDDRGRRLTAYKTRTALTHPYASAGSRFEDLYGSWRDRRRAQVILCEGESDTWRCALEFPDHDVFGLPAGANQPPKGEWVARFKDREVTIIFDADTPGRKAAKRWYEALRVTARSVRIVSLEDGADACSTSDLVGAYMAASEVPLWTGQVTLAQAGTHYVRVASGQPVCNWAIEPERLIELEDGAAIEGNLVGTRKTVIITSEDVVSESALRRWSLQHSRVWFGSTKDAQSLWEYLLWDGPFLAKGYGTRVAGWHANHVVLPEETIGPRHWVYVAPVTDPGVERITRRAYPKDGDAATLTSVLALHRPEIISPIVAWAAAAPIRSLCYVFPPLAVVGGAGTGKTTLISEVLRVFGWNGHEHNLTSTTPHGVAVTVASTNGVPVWFDEYRRGTRHDTREAFNQALRDAWTASEAVRGGLRSNLSSLSVFQAQAPIVVSGEDAFSETSHAERMVIVTIPPDGRNVQALERLRAGQASIGRLYLRWLVERAQRGDPVAPTIPMADRPQQANHVLEHGWGLLSEFAMEVWSLQLPELDLSDVEEERAAILRVNPILDAVNWGLNESDRGNKPLAWASDDDVYVRVRALVTTVRKDNILDLPGGERAIIQWLRERYRGRAKQERTNYGLALRLIGARQEIERLHLEDDDVPGRGSGEGSG